MNRKDKNIISRNKGTITLIFILCISLLFKSEFDSFANFLEGKINIINFCIIYFILGSFSLPTIPLALLGYNLYGILNTSLFTSISITTIVLFQIKFNNTIGLRISKDEYIETISEKLIYFSYWKKMATLLLLRANPILPLHIISGIGKSLLNNNKNILPSFIIVIYLGSIICSSFLGILYLLIL